MAKSLNSLNRTIQRWKRYRTTVRELESMNKRELSELGLERGDIHAIARRAAQNL
ncbi:Uncharacterized conserved protein YjiS, DUF1127 family [Faunimonas pinastri]|uniref:Uncharacterized conserved protein YjiS, DUF1127 family n=1 Tax=Faunimonas pinastri TaxID=1855383 RepID=A0A1H9ARG2_9HYPH|nr:DUF1127 domain-containing protein [Faunimonas pinastri]SEP79239.1 Uncharacterized conserved protein YjiS, DUF1127 family [Faunimonas pinastri]